MDSTRARDLIDTLARAARNDAADDPPFSEDLGQLEWMHFLLLPGADSEVDGADGSRRFVEAQGDDGVGRPRVFVEPDVMREFAESNDDVRRLHYYECRSERWLAGLMRLLREGADGVVLHIDGENEVELSRENLGALVAAFAVEWFVDDPEMCVVMQGEKVYYYASQSDHRCAFVFDSRDVAGDHLERMRERVPGVRMGAVDRSILLEGLLQADVSKLFVNPGLDDQRAYDRPALELIQDLRKGVDPQRKPRTVAKPQRTESTQDGAKRQQTVESPAPKSGAVDSSTTESAMTPRVSAQSVPGPARTDADSRARLLEIKALADAGTRQSWLVSELLAHDIDLWVPVVASTQGPWPLVERRSVDGREVGTALLYSNEPMARMALRHYGREDVKLRRVPGIEAFRWVWSGSDALDEVLVDHPAPDGYLAVPSRSIPSMLFPSLLGVRELDHVPIAPWDRLAALPHSHGLKPEVVRAFVDNWTELSGPPRDGSQPPIEHDGGLYLPVFTHTDRFYEYRRQADGRAPIPQVAGADPPFLRWLRLASRCDGVVVDPASEVPMTLKPSDLFYLHLWSESRRPPEGRQVSAALAILQRGDYPLDMRAAGRIAADWPMYVGARYAGTEALVCAPGTDDLALFTSEGELQDFARLQRRAGGSAQDLEAVPLVPRWRDNFFQIANERHSGIRIDPGSRNTTSGVHLDGKGLDGAIARLDERLRPRVPGFGVLS